MQMEKSQRGRELVPASIAAAVALAGATAIYFMDFGLGTGVQLPGTTLATSGILICANSWAEPNSSTRKPTDRKRLLRVARIATSSSMTKTVDSLALAGSCDDLARWVTTHPLDARAGRIETSHPAPHC